MKKQRSEMEHKYTSTGKKFWRHRDKLEAYKRGDANTIISTHISPEGSCNLKCSYCSVANRDTHERIELSAIKEYVLKLKSLGLKACILSGGGEPTLYPEFNELVSWLHDSMNLKVALITNGTQSNRVNVWNMFSWVRVSINNFPNWDTRIKIPIAELNSQCVVGLSMIYSGKNIEILNDVSHVATRMKAKYIRLLPDCKLDQKELLEWHDSLASDLIMLNDKRFFHQFKIHGAPNTKICHQAYFRPYLSEVKGGTVFPCDSLVLNDTECKFSDKYAICKSNEVLDFFNRKINMKFYPCDDCPGCVFTDNIELLDNFMITGNNNFDKYMEPLEHEEFV